MTATGADKKHENVKIAILLHTIGEEGLEVYNTLTIDYFNSEIIMILINNIHYYLII